MREDMGTGKKSACLRSKQKADKSKQTADMHPPHRGDVDDRRVADVDGDGAAAQPHQRPRRDVLHLLPVDAKPVGWQDMRQVWDITLQGDTSGRLKRPVDSDLGCSAILPWPAA